MRIPTKISCQNPRQFWIVGQTSACITIALFVLSSVSIGQLDAPERRQELAVRVHYNVVYGESAEPMHRADIYSPKAMDADDKLPGIIMIHGGAWTLGDKSHDAQHAKRLANLGFVVMTINYRLAPLHAFPAQLDDCYLALDWFAKHSGELGVDTDRMGSWGYSAGGHLSALLALKPKDDLPRLKACVVGAAPCDLTQVPLNSSILSGVLGGTRSEYPDRYLEASPIAYVSSDDPPVFLFHGSKDWLVPPKSSQAMKLALEKVKVPFEYLVVPNKAHLSTFIDQQASEKSFFFLKERLILGSK